jgi:hypothetical protein
VTRVTTRRVVVGACLLLGAGGSAAVMAGVFDRPERFVISESYAFDVTNRGYLAGFADVVAAGRVEKVGAADQEATTTSYTISVTEALKGDVPDVIEVAQLGYRDGEDTYVSESQPLLVAGREYVLVLRRQDADPSKFQVVAGPESAREIPGASSDVVTADWEADWRDAIRNQQYPPGVPGRPA